MLENKVLRILVIDDTAYQLEAAQQQLGQRKLTLASSYDEAVQCLQRPVDQARLAERLVQVGITKENEFEGNNLYRMLVLEDECRGATTIRRGPDRSIDASHEQQDRYSRYAGQMMPVGFALVFLAVLHGVRQVAVYTNNSHHDHPSSAMLDRFVYWGGGISPRTFVMNGSTVRFFQQESIESGVVGRGDSGNVLLDSIPCKTCGGVPFDDDPTAEPCSTCCGRGGVWVKDWATALRLLLEENPT